MKYLINDNIARAIDFAAEAHKGQYRKYSDNTVPYVVHPIEVSELVAAVPHTEAMIIAALLHDTVEDTDVSLDDIQRTFGDKVYLLVEMLTDISDSSDGNRAVRKAKDLAHTAKSSPEAKTIKLADLISNTISIVEHDPNFARVYLKEKIALLEVLKEGDATLWKQANDISKSSLLRINSVN